MSLSRARNAAQMRVRRALAKGEQPKPTDEFAKLPKLERMNILAELAMARTSAPVTPGHKILAIKELNLMEHIYDVAPRLQDNRQYNIIIQGGEETKAKLERLLSGKMPPLASQNFQLDTPERRL